MQIFLFKYLKSLVNLYILYYRMISLASYDFLKIFGVILEEISSSWWMMVYTLENLINILIS